MRGWLCLNKAFRWWAEIFGVIGGITAGLDMVIPVICGNDYYKSGRILEFDTAWLDAVTELCQLVVQKVWVFCGRRRIFGNMAVQSENEC